MEQLSLLTREIKDDVERTSGLNLARARAQPRISAFDSSPNIRRDTPTVGFLVI